MDIYRVPFTCHPYHPHPSRALPHSSEGELRQNKVQRILEKHTIEESSHKVRGFLSTVFLSQRLRSETSNKLKDLECLHTHEALQDGMHTCPKRPAGDWMAKVDLRDA